MFSPCCWLVLGKPLESLEIQRSVFGSRCQYLVVSAALSRPPNTHTRGVSQSHISACTSSDEYHQPFQTTVPPIQCLPRLPAAISAPKQSSGLTGLTGRSVSNGARVRTYMDAGCRHGVGSRSCELTQTSASLLDGGTGAPTLSSLLLFSQMTEPHPGSRAFKSRSP